MCVCVCSFTRYDFSVIRRKTFAIRAFTGISAALVLLCDITLFFFLLDYYISDF